MLHIPSTIGFGWAAVCTCTLMHILTLQQRNCSRGAAVSLTIYFTHTSSYCTYNPRSRSVGCAQERLSTSLDTPRPPPPPKKK
ncbi:hypothetical protein QBC46DRAFT_370341 [Diplogelasinospora grovesii]|uniref:Uncharacterized protein n=1 Tax=Diplogelasinospora grovesii TaxID=303347 RepID=A0AAN6NHK0_9PEZI|nr:hypothetical protein QBC46DRAFT_370341 [Diplogelasinospora grovesii]